jgi:uncharacterized hydrophobic protein (TIGR00271 family)
VDYNLSGRRPVPRGAVAALLGVGLLMGGGLEYGLGADNLYALLVAGVTIALTSLTLFELMDESSETAGSYRLVAQTAGVHVSFLTGWLLVSAYFVLAADLLRALGVLVAELTSFPLSPTYLSLALLVLLFLRRRYLDIRGRRARDILVSLSVLGFAALLVGILLSDVWSLPQSPETFDPAGLWHEAGRLAVVFIAVEIGISTRGRVSRDWLAGVRSAIWALLSALAVIGLPLIVISGFPGGVDSLWQLATRATKAPVGLAVSLEFVLFLLSIEILVSGVIRTLQDMGLGGSPPLERAQTGAKPWTSVVVYITLALALGAATALGLALPMLEVAAGMILLTVIVINVVGIVRGKAGSKRRRGFNLPLYPLIPAIAAGLAVSLILNLSPLAQAAALLWVAPGFLLFLFTRRRDAAAAEGSVERNAADHMETPPENYRILLPLTFGGQDSFPLKLAAAIARQMGGEILPLKVIPNSGVAGPSDASRNGQSNSRWVASSEDYGHEPGVAVRPITCLAESVADGVIETATKEDCNLLVVPWAIDGGQSPTRSNQELETIITLSPCDTAVLTYKSAGPERRRSGDGSWSGNGLPIKNIQVLTSDGLHASLAAGLGLALAREFGARARTCQVRPGESPARRHPSGGAHDSSVLQQMFRKIRNVLVGRPTDVESSPPAADPKAVRADGIQEGVLESSAEADLILIGASQESLLDQLLFGAVPLRVEVEATTPVILVRRFQGLPRLWFQRIWNSVAGAVPTLGADEQDSTYARLERGARPDVDFFVMMGLSATIATIGLLLNSGAVIIGAMLVAPLLTPFLAISLAISTGDLRLLRLAVESSLKGVFVAVAIGLSIGALASLPLDVSNLPEIASRTQPNLLDLGVALAAGAAGAYAVGRKEVATALPGVAIAAALVPPLAVVGINLAAGHFDRAGGAALLVLTNLIAISMAGSITLLLLGFRPAAQAESKAHFRNGLAATVILMMIVVMPLATVLARSIHQSALEEAVTRTLQRRFESIEDARVTEVNIDAVDQGLHVSATVYSSSTEVQVRQLGLVDALESQTGSDVELSLVLIPRLELDNTVSNDGTLFDWRNRSD